MHILALIAVALGCFGSIWFGIALLPIAAIIGTHSATAAPTPESAVLMASIGAAVPCAAFLAAAFVERIIIDIPVVPGSAQLPSVRAFAVALAAYLVICSKAFVNSLASISAIEKLDLTQRLAVLAGLGGRVFFCAGLVAIATALLSTVPEVFVRWALREPTLEVPWTAVRTACIALVLFTGSGFIVDIVAQQFALSSILRTP